jgi:mRNA-degrading endonuclease toxin of MazEF toxin-antitoxin module
MPGRNGKQNPPRPQIELQSDTASAEETAAIAAALERFLWETAPAPAAVEVSRWQQTALREGVSARTGLGNGWGIAPGA